MISIYDWFGYEVPIEDRYKLIKAAGFDGVLLWWSNGFGRGADYRDGVQYARNAGLIIENIHTPVQEQNKLSLDNLDGEGLIKCYLQCIKDCAEFDIPTMVVHLPDDKYPINELGMERIKRIVEKAEKLNINVAMENLRNIDNVTRVLDSIDSNKIGFCYDSCHHENYYSERDLLGKYGKRLMAMHLHDNGGVRGQHQLPFDGNINWERVMGEIEGSGYKGATTLEPMNWGYEDLSMQEFLSNAYKKAKKLEEKRIG
ncbi:sugar phosphate isomerase/epimerase [Clostridium sp. DSM 100503]|uniref:sugar phosphate isomerase/epimerase family protein n=1 Tax=Clostridium sp. DSM 100503 TaxID=2963282 RepID=UPI00214A7BA8|nr:sugar phosphate isomerase/epimerase family protein [Clostridium sp. DSM 100503]MCR1950472.1 sugar phosphate isomerase/epimerase [Clostridium sp. DSM 100503]